jgi:hypothetical protein
MTNDSQHSNRWLIITVIGFGMTAISLTWAITNVASLARFKDLDKRVIDTELSSARYDERLKSIEKQLDKVILLLENK